MPTLLFDALKLHHIYSLYPDATLLPYPMQEESRVRQSQLESEIAAATKALKHAQSDSLVLRTTQEAAVAKVRNIPRSRNHRVF